MSYTALYRKFRPGTFDEVKGQDPIVITLKNQVRTQRVGHAYLFCGTRGTGKTTVAKVLAKAVNCEHPEGGNPCNSCPTCQKIAAQTSLNVIEIDAASNNGVANVRDIIEEVRYSPAEGKYKVYIIDEVHMLSAGAFNALLKTLEEPPSYVIFILATTEPHKIPVTIHSRCQRYDFARISADTIAGHLKSLAQRENVRIQQQALFYIAKQADGSMRDALSLLDRCVAFSPEEELSYDRVLDILGAVDTEVTGKLFRAVAAQDVLSCIRLLDKMVMTGKDLDYFVTEFIWYIRSLMLLSAAKNGEALVDVSARQLAQMKKDASLLPTESLMRLIHVLSDLSSNLRYATQKRVLTEIALIRLCRPQMDERQDLTTIEERISALEKKMEAGSGANPGGEKDAAPPASAEAPSESAEAKFSAEEKSAEAPSESPDAKFSAEEKGAEAGAFVQSASADAQSANADAELSDIVKDWDKITASLLPIERMMLGDAAVRVQDGALVLAFKAESDRSFFLHDDGDKLQKLAQLVEKSCGKTVEILTRVGAREEKREEKAFSLAPALEKMDTEGVETVVLD